jgi:glycosyltransferase involved in cell wall biosynthesis
MDPESFTNSKVTVQNTASHEAEGATEGAAFSVSVIMPARNEAASLPHVLASVTTQYPTFETIIVDDGSTDDTIEICARYGVTCITHPYPKGNGSAIKSGARAARGTVLVFMDADSQHDAADIARLVSKLDQGFDMVVGARDSASQASWGRWFANSLYNRLASWVVGHTVEDLTSGFRAVKAEQFREFLYLLPNGFSYPTTCTMAFFRSGYSVGYLPIRALRREGVSHIRPLRDGLRFLLIMTRICTLYSPLRIFLPCSMLFFFTGMSYYVYTYASDQRFTNMSALLLSTSVIVFLIGLVSEQITALTYKDVGGK